MKIVLAPFNPTVGDVEGNRSRILELARTAKTRGAELAVFQELCMRGYLPGNAAWLGDYLHELACFPNRKHDYQVDSTSQALD